MSQRKKIGLGMIITGALFLIAGIVTFIAPATPSWLPTILAIVGSIAGVLGLAVTLPSVP